jgi:hypothetical protein
MTVRNRRSAKTALDLRRFILAMHRGRKWYQPRVTVKDIRREYAFTISEKTAQRAVQWLREHGYLDSWEAPPAL